MAEAELEFLVAEFDQEQEDEDLLLSDDEENGADDSGSVHVFTAS